MRTAQRNEWYLNTYGPGRGLKRVAAVLGDFVFTLARRLALEGMKASHPQVPLWSSLSSPTHGLAPYWGTPHGADVTLLFGGFGIAAESTRTYYLSFLYKLDPNDDTKRYRNWPPWTPEDKNMIFTTLFGNTEYKDDFRDESFAFLQNSTQALYF